jgi:hypothetical protein
MYVTVTVINGVKKILPWTMWICSEEHNFAKLFEKVKERLPDNCKDKPITACMLAKATD